MTVFISGLFGEMPSLNLVEGLVATAFSAATAFLLWLLWSAPTSVWLATRPRMKPNLYATTANHPQIPPSLRLTEKPQAD